MSMLFPPSWSHGRWTEDEEAQMEEALARDERFHAGRPVTRADEWLEEMPEAQDDEDPIDHIDLSYGRSITRPKET